MLQYLTSKMKFSLKVSQAGDESLSAGLHSSGALNTSTCTSTLFSGSPEEKKEHQNDF